MTMMLNVAAKNEELPNAEYFEAGENNRKIMCQKIRQPLCFCRYNARIL
jgi:hypothetical protein